MLVQEHPESEQRGPTSNPAPAAAAAPAELPSPAPEGCRTLGGLRGTGNAKSAENQHQRHKVPVLAELLMGEVRGDAIAWGHLPRKQKCGERGGSA